MAQMEVMRVYVNVPEGYSNDIRIGMPAELHIGGFPNRVFTGKVAHTSGAIDTGFAHLADRSAGAQSQRAN